MTRPSNNAAAYTRGFADGRQGLPHRNDFSNVDERLSYEHGYDTGKEVRRVNSKPEEAQQ